MCNYYGANRQQFPFGQFGGFIPGFAGIQPQPPFGQPGPPFGQQGGQFGPPSGPPPSFVPQQAQEIGVMAVDPGAISGCLFRFVFIRLTNGQRFWAWLVFVGPRSIAGWRWTGNRWVYFGIDLERISSFQCF